MAQADKKRILILLSAYNGEKYLREQLESLVVLEGDFAFTLRVRDDGSTDGTAKILSEYREKYGIEVIFGENVGYNRSFFELLEGAEEGYDYYALCDQDDVWLPFKFVRACSLLVRKGGTGERPLLYSGVLCLADETLEKRKTLRYPKKPVNFYNAMFECLCSGHTMVFNAALLRKLKGSWREGLMSYDHWILLAATAFGDVIYDTEPQVVYRQHGANAVGASGNPFGKLMRRVRYLFADRSRAMARQLEAFYGVFSAQMKAAYAQELEKFLSSRKNFCTRFCYAAKSRAYRQRGAETFFFKVLYVFGGFNAAAKE